MARNYPVWARSLIDPTSFEHEQARLGQIWTLLGVVTDVTNDGDWFRTILGGRSIFVQRFGEDLRGFEKTSPDFDWRRAADMGARSHSGDGAGISDISSGARRAGRSERRKSQLALARPELHQ